MRLITPTLTFMLITLTTFSHGYALADAPIPATYASRISAAGKIADLCHIYVTAVLGCLGTYDEAA